MNRQVLVTCPPMLGMLDRFLEMADQHGLELIAAKTTQTLSEAELLDLVPQHEGWIIGDDPATARVFEAGRAGMLRAAVKWGIGVDNVDLKACETLGIPVANTPNMFGGEVADMAIGYIVGLARETFYIDREIRRGRWPKPPGISIEGKHVGIVGYGDIGRNLERRLSGFNVQITVYDPDPGAMPSSASTAKQTFPIGLDKLDFLVITCSLNKDNFHMIDASAISQFKRGLRLINVARGPLIDEKALQQGLEEGAIAAAALDVFEVEPLPDDSPLRAHPGCIFGSHNSSNTVEGVTRASNEAITRLAAFLDG